jgi:aryl-alcohol dehydrogenase-like predicted oxidoreductase/spore coat polysaccharide biosynthesis protein SpsF (cytidylyltransferase family)
VLRFRERDSLAELGNAYQFSELMRSVIILQVRSTSARLPGKALMPVAGYPSSVLAGLRARNAGHIVIMATSTEPSDDALAKLFRDHGFRVVRGPLNDVLARYALAAEDLADDQLVVRLTGDNLVPDGHLVKDLEEAFASRSAEYVSHGSLQGRLPYGVHAEAFSVATLRRAHAAATSSYDREHVTPWIIRNCVSAVHVPRAIGNADFSHLRCTIDDESDYEAVCRLFEGVADPLRVSWIDLTRKLASMPKQPAFRVPYRIHSGRLHSEIVLGTAQLGMNYGVANRTGKPARSSAVQIVRSAIAHGVTAIDTARAYGDAEEILGDALRGAWSSRSKVITKLHLPDSLSHDAKPKEVRAAVDASVQRSFDALRLPRLATVLLHHWDHYRAFGGVAWQRLLELREQGKISTLGVSVSEPHEALSALQDPDIQHLQIPMNVIDWRWKAEHVDRALTARPDVVVHGRSALLQGILLSPPDVWPVSQSYASNCVRHQNELARKFGRDGVIDLCFAYVRSQPWITAVIVGCETLEQLAQNLRLFRLPHLTPQQCIELENLSPRAPKELLNPSRWNRVHEYSPA